MNTLFRHTTPAVAGTLFGLSLAVLTAAAPGQTTRGERQGSVGGGAASLPDGVPSTFRGGVTARGPAAEQAVDAGDVRSRFRGGVSRLGNVVDEELDAQIRSEFGDEDNPAIADAEFRRSIAEGHDLRRRAAMREAAQDRANRRNAELDSRNEFGDDPSPERPDDVSDPRAWQRNAFRDPGEWNRDRTTPTASALAGDDTRRTSAGAGATFDVNNLRPADIGLFFRTTNDGITIADVSPTGAIAPLGFREGDRILSINGQAVTTEDEFIALLFDQQTLGSRVPITILRRGRLQIVLANPQMLLVQANQSAFDPLSQFGITLDDRFTDQLRVWRVAPRSPAFFAGIRPGDVITAVDGQAITDLGAFVRLLLDAEGTLSFTLTRNGRTREIDVDLTATNFSSDLDNRGLGDDSSLPFSGRRFPPDRGEFDEFNLAEPPDDLPDDMRFKEGPRRGPAATNAARRRAASQRRAQHETPIPPPDYVDPRDDIFGGQRFNLPDKPDVPPGTRVKEGGAPGPAGGQPGPMRGTGAGARAGSGAGIRAGGGGGRQAE